MIDTYNVNAGFNRKSKNKTGGQPLNVRTLRL